MTLPDKPDALEYAARQGQVQADINYQEPNAKRVFVLFCKDHWHKKRRGWTISNGPSWRHSMRINLDPTRHIPEPSVQIPESHVPEPVQIPESHVPEPVQIPESHVPEPPVQIPPEHIPEVSSLEPTLTDAASLDQLMSFVFGEALQLLHTVLSIFDGDLISSLDEFERELAMEPMDLTLLRLNPCVIKSIGFKAIQPMNLPCS
ncbi:hypothetical protein TNCV_81981 [Trichonephila clavipes]|nr:hypothetical protein TNCV_81981 [Trichonephila clavipes]